MRSEVPKETTTEWIDKALDLVDKFKAVLEAARAFTAVNDDMVADGGEPFLANEPLFIPKSITDELVADGESILAADLELIANDPDFNVVPVQDNGRDSLERVMDERLDAEEASMASTPKRRRRRKSKIDAAIRKGVMALISQEPRPLLSELSEEFGISQSSVSRIIADAKRESERSSLPGQMQFPISGLDHGQVAGPKLK